MNPTTASTFSADRFLRLETAPAFGQGKLDAAADQTFCLLAHLFPIIIFPWKRHDSPAVAAHSKEALNFGLTLLICLFPLSLIAGFLGTAVALIVGLLSTVVSLAALGLMIYAMLQARQGRLLRYPLNFRLIK